MMNPEAELQIYEQLELVDKLIEDLKLHSFVQAMAIGGSAVVSPDDLKENGETCLKMRNKIAEVLVVLKDIKENSFDEMGPLCQMRVEQAITRCQQNIDGFDSVFAKMLNKEDLPDAELPVLLEQILTRSDELKTSNETFTQYILSSKANPKFDVYSSDDVAELITDMKKNVGILKGLLDALSKKYNKDLPGLMELIKYSDQTITDYEHNKEHQGE